MIVQINSAVYDDLREAIEYYAETAGSQIAIQFYEQFQLSIELIKKRPLSFPVYLEDDTEIRRTNFKRFPFHLLFKKVGTDTLRILVVRHDHRHPSYGLERW